MMGNDSYLIQNTNTHLFLMASLSPEVAKCLEQETYRFSADVDESTENHILEQCVYAMLKDVETIGVTLDIDPSDYIEDHNALSQLIQCVELILPNGLYPTLKRDECVRNLIRDILLGSIGDGSSVIHVYLSELAALDGGIPHRLHLVDAIDRLYTQISQTGVFTGYLKNMLDLLEQEKNAPESDPERHILYNRKVREIIGLLSDAVNLFDKDVDYTSLLKIQNIIIKDFLSPDNFIEYAYLLLESPDTLPPELESGYSNKWMHYNVSHKWRWFYYPTRKIKTIERPYQIINACFTYAISASKEQYQERMMPMRMMFPDDHVDNQILTLYATKD